MAVASVVLLLFAALPLRAQEPSALPILATTGPWTYATAPVLFQNRVWFANANRWPDHNSADIWSVAADGGTPRFERRLFSQDVGKPIVHDGLLYWPHEDPRVSLGWGEVSVTNGEDWRVLQTRTGRQFHLHSLHSRGEQLLAGGSAWSAQILSTDDRGGRWTQLYERERLEKRFSRTYHLIETPFGLYGDVIEFGNGPRGFGLLRHGAGEPEPVRDWPATTGLVHRMTAWQGGFLVLRGTGEARELLHIQSPQDQNPVPLPAGVLAIDLDADQAIWLLGQRAAGVYGIWILERSAWRQVYRFRAKEAVELRLLGGKPIVAGTDKGKGHVWGRAGKTAFDTPSPLPVQIWPEPFDRDTALGQIRDALDDPRAYAGHGLRLRNVLDKWITRGLKGSDLEPFLSGPFPEGEPVRLIGGRAFASHERFGRWLLTWAMRTSGSGTVPEGWLSLPFTEKKNRSEKYFSEPLAAIWTATTTMRGNTRAAEILMQRPGTDPAWLRADIRAAIRLIER